MAKKRASKTTGEAQTEAEVLADAEVLAQVLQFSDYVNRPRRAKRLDSDAAMPVLDEAMRNLHAAAHAALKLIFLARHKMGLPQL